jgi:hypothetical protein
MDEYTELQGMARTPLGRRHPGLRKWAEREAAACEHLDDAGIRAHREQWLREREALDRELATWAQKLKRWRSR